MATTLLSSLTETITDSIKKIRILVWYDEGGTLQDLVEEAAPKGIQLIKFEGSYLTIRAQIEKEKDFTKKRLIYVPESPPSPSWLRDYEIFGARLDLTLPILLSQSYGVRLTKDLKTILTAQNCRKLAKKWNQVLGAVDTPLPEETLKEAILATCFGQPHQFDMKRAILTYLKYSEHLSKELDRCNLAETFLEVLRKEYGFKYLTGKGVEAGRLAAAILLTEFVRNSGGLAETELSDLLAEKEHWGFWMDLAAYWSSSVDFWDSFVKWSKDMEDKYKIQNKIKGRKGVENVLSFRAVDEFLLEEVKARIGEEGLKGILKNADFIEKVAEKRSSLVWTRMGLFKEWEVLSTSVDLLRLMQESLSLIDKESLSFSVLVKNYAADDGWWRIDNLYRRLASSDRNVDSKVQTLFVELPRKQYQEWLRKIGNQVAAAAEKMDGWHVEGAMNQRAFWKELVRPHQEKTAVFLIDALRYELQKKLLSDLRKSGFRVNHSVMISALPSITEVGMSSLLPHERLTIEVVDGDLQVFLDESKISTKDEREKWLKSKYGEQVAIVDFDSIKDPKALAENTKGKRLLVIMDRKIDKAGSFIINELLDNFDRLSDRVKRGVEIVTQSGYSKVLVTTDHGFLFLPYPKKVNTLREISSRSDVALGRRYALGRPPKVNGAFSRSLNSLGYDGGDLHALFPIGIAFFPQPGPKEPFIHGGVSLQECCIGVLEITAAKEAIGEKVDVKLVLPDIITSAIFTVGFHPVPKQLIAIPRKLIVELYVEGELLLRSDPIELAYSPERLTIKLPKIPKMVEVRVKDVETEEILYKRNIPAALEGYDELL